MEPNPIINLNKRSLAVVLFTHLTLTLTEAHLDESSARDLRGRGDALFDALPAPAQALYQLAAEKVVQFAFAEAEAQASGQAGAAVDITREELKEIFRKIHTKQEEHGDFLTGFAKAIMYADHENIRLIETVGLMLCAKYDLWHLRHEPGSAADRRRLKEKEGRRGKAGAQ
jgi:hypothetical protein